MPVLCLYRRPLTYGKSVLSVRGERTVCKRTHLDQVHRDVLAQKVHETITGDVCIRHLFSEGVSPRRERMIVAARLIRQDDVVQLVRELRRQLLERAEIAYGEDSAKSSS